MNDYRNLHESLKEEDNNWRAGWGRWDLVAWAEAFVWGVAVTVVVWWLS